MSDHQISLLKQVLDNLKTPELLNEHPWTKSLFFDEYASRNRSLQNTPGLQLAYAVTNSFEKMIPGLPPKNGKRLDTRWGEFGVLAAMYFAPFLTGTPYPSSLRDAWGKTDQAILHFVYGKDRGALGHDDLLRYQLIGDQLDAVPVSTISDWHRKGLAQLAKVIAERENFLSMHMNSNKPLLHHDDQVGGMPSKQIEGQPPLAPKKRYMSMVRRIFFVVLLIGIALLAYKGWRSYELIRLLQADLAELQKLPATASGNIEMAKTAGPLLKRFRLHTTQLQAEAGPVLRVVSLLGGWVPVYGSDVAASADLLDMAAHISRAVDLSYTAGEPTLLLLDSDSGSLSVGKITQLVRDANPQLMEARRELDQGLAFRSKINAQALSPSLRSILSRADPLLALMDDGLSMAVVLPKLLGATTDGPKTYLILVQNEDELRSTGGFITAIGTFVIKDGNILVNKFSNTGLLDDWSLPYPDPPWQLMEYMNSNRLVLRDANWFPDYPTTVSWVEFLYAYTEDHSVDGVVAIDQQAIVILLQSLGSVSVKDANGNEVSVNSGNVIQYMIDYKNEAGVAKKDFIDILANAIIKKMLGNENLDWKKVLLAVQQAMNERHILLQLDDPIATQVLARRNWDGAVRPGDSDFLMAIDSNVGFNKTNIVVERRLIYDVDLTDLSHPVSQLSIFHENHAEGLPSCVHWSKEDKEDYPINYCYWNYLRVYVPTETRVLDANPKKIPAGWMIGAKPVPARVDTLDEGIPGVQGFGLLMVVPGGRSNNTSFKFELPARVIAPVSGNQRAYRLRIQKQPGTLANPIDIRIHLPSSVKIDSVTPEGVNDGQNILFKSTLQTDFVLEIIFTVP